MMLSVQKPSRLITTKLAAGSVTIATFAKFFTPFYLIGSTAIFGAASVLGFGLFAARWRPILGAAVVVRNLLAVIALFYAVVTINFLLLSLHEVPLTYLVGILIFHLIFFSFGFAASQALDAVFAVLSAQAVIYFLIFLQYAIRFGDFMRDGYLRDVFGIGYRPLYIGVHQEIGAQVALAALAGLGLSKGRGRLPFVLIFPLIFWFLYHIQARTAAIALPCALILLAIGELCLRSRKLAIVTGAALIAATVAMSLLSYEYIIHRRNIDPTATDPISRTIVEIRNPAPFLRLSIWNRAWHRIASEPNHLLFGRGIGTFPIDEGVGPPDWLLKKTAGATHYPHNVHLELLYEAGIVGVFIFCILTAWPLLSALKNWREFSNLQKSAFSIYIFYLISMDISGSFAFSYDFQFFLALAIGASSLKQIGASKSSSTKLRSAQMS